MPIGIPIGGFAAPRAIDSKDRIDAAMHIATGRRGLTLLVGFVVAFARISHPPPWMHQGYSRAAAGAVPAIAETDDANIAIVINLRMLASRTSRVASSRFEPYHITKAAALTLP